MSQQILNVTSTYQPTEKGKIFHSSPAKYKVVKGGLGSGKTRMAVEEVVALLAEYPDMEMFVFRKTMPSLRDSTLNEFLKFIPNDLGVYQEKYVNFLCANKSKCMFRGLDEPTKIKSTNVSVILLDEADEFNREDFITLKGRIRQMSEEGQIRFPLHFILVFNPVDDTHWLYQEFVENFATYDADGGCLVMELSTYDNIDNLPPGYITQVTAGMTPDEIDRFIFGKWGTIVKGKPIYGDLFRADLHIKKWVYGPHLLIKRGWDFGFNRPAVVWRLFDQFKRKNIDFEMMGKQESLDTFAPKVIAATEARYGPNLKIWDYCDPRGFDKSDKGQTSVEILNDFGIYPIGERKVRAYVEPGIKVVRKELSTLIAGEPELTINPECAIIRAAYAGKYARGDDGEPIKEGHYEHICDADRYIAYNDRTNNAVREAINALQQKRATRLVNKITGYGRG